MAPPIEGIKEGSASPIVLAVKSPKLSKSKSSRSALKLGTDGAPTCAASNLFFAATPLP